MPAYMIYARTAVTDAEVSKRYSEQVVPQIIDFGGEILTARGMVHAVEGEWNPQSVTIVKFADMEAMTRWYESLEYAPLKEMRLASNTGDIIAIDVS